MSVSGMAGGPAAEGGVPRVSIGLPVYNGEDFLAEALDSLLGQTFRDFEIIIGDNASVDSTEEICRAAARRDPRIRYIRHDQNLGAAPNYNNVFELARGELFKWAAHDDICAPTMLEQCVAVFDQRDDAALVAPLTRIIDAAGAIVRDLKGELELLEDLPHQRLNHFFRHHNFPQACNPVFGLMRRELLGRTELIDSYPASDMVLLARLALEGKLVLVPEYLFLRREHPNTSVQRNRSWKDRATWFNTKRASRVQMVYWRWFWEYLRNIQAAEMSWAERYQCGVETLRWVLRRRAALWRDLWCIPASLLD